MKSIVAVVALFGFFERCQDIPLPEHPGHHHEAGRAAPGGNAGSEARDAGSPEEPDEEDAGSTPTAACSGPPELYSDDNCKTLAEGVRSYRPLYELWADGAGKERFIYLPPGTQIDTANPDRWNFPVGTRIYKTFSLNGKRLETRVMRKHTAGPSIDNWTFTAYAWSDDQRKADAADANGASNVLGTQHDIPSQMQCKTCHSMQGADAVNGFGAIQLNHDRRGWSLRKLIDADLLANGTSSQPNVTLSNARLPGDIFARDALGYLHGNCGNCHGGPMPRAGLSLWSVVGTRNVSDTGVAKTGVCQCLTRWRDRSARDGAKYVLRVAPGDAAHSGIIGRMAVRGMGEQMPPIGSEVIDMIGLDTVSDFIDELSSCPAEPNCAPPAAGAGGASGGGAGAGGSRTP